MILANVGIPSFLPHFSLMLVGLFIVTAVETVTLRKVLGQPWWASYRATLTANLYSTLVGLPFAWMLILFGLVGTSMLASLTPLKDSDFLGAFLSEMAFNGGSVPGFSTELSRACAALVLLIPFYFMSVWIERRHLQKKFSELDRAVLGRAVRRMNLHSYSIFLVLRLVGLVAVMVE